MLKPTIKKEREKTLEPSLKKYVEQTKKGWCIKLLSQFISGLPDRICLIPPGIIFFVEAKSTGKKPSPIQKIVHAKLRRLGFEVWVLDSTEVLNQIKQKYDGLI